MTERGGVGHWPDDPPRAHVLREVIKSILDHSERVVITHHAEEQMVDRGLTRKDIDTVLRSGEIEGHIEPGKNAGEWKCAVYQFADIVRSNREIGVITIVVECDRLIIKTVMWKDEMK